jgi:ubiquinol-cytochrome c reductase cytochrome c subunit
VRHLNRQINGVAGRLSRHRRRPVAGFVLLLLGLVLTGGLYSAFAPSAQAEQATAQAELAAEGRELFLVGCAFCHGQNGEGVTGDQLGPTLAGVGAAAVDFQVGTGRMPMAQVAQQNPSKPAAYGQEEIDALAAYVASLAPGPDVPNPADYSLAALSEEEREEAVARGGLIWRTNCTACHNFAGSGGAMPQGGYAPAVTDTQARYIYEAMLTGPGNMDNFSNGNLSPEEKRDVIAYLYELREQPEFGGFGMGNLGPVVDGLVTWVVGIGVLVGFAVWIAAHSTRSTKPHDTSDEATHPEVTA